MDAKTSAALNSITPNYSGSHQQTVPIADELMLEAPPSYEVTIAPSQSTAISSTAPGQAHHAPGTTATARSSSSSVNSQSHLQTGYQEQYTPPKPMRAYFTMDDATRAKLENSPGCCFSSSGGCCFSDMGGCCFSHNAGCCFSDNSGCCFSDNAGCCFSDNAGCCFSDHEGGCCSDPGPDAARRRGMRE